MTVWYESFTDTETTGLDLDGPHELWELALGTRRPGQPDIASVWQFRVDLTNADPKALEINRYHERFAVPDGYDAAYIAFDGVPHPMTTREAIDEIRDRVKNTILVGSNTQFDAQALRKLVGPNLWHYRPVNALELAVGWLLAKGEKIDLPWDSAEVSRMIGVEPPVKGEAHTALADMVWARNVYDKVIGQK